MKRRTGTHKRAPVLYGAKRFDHGGSPPAVHQSNRQSPAAIDIILHGRGKKQPQNLLYDRSGPAAADNAKGFVADFLSPVDVALGLRNVAGGELRKDLFVDIVGFLRHLRIGGLPAADIWYIPLSALLTNINAIRLYMHNTCILPHPISPTQKTEYLHSILHFAPVVNALCPPRGTGYASSKNMSAPLLRQGVVLHPALDLCHGIAPRPGPGDGL